MAARSRQPRPQAHSRGSQRAQHERRPGAQRPEAIPPVASRYTSHMSQRHHLREGVGEIAFFAAFVRQSDNAYVVRDLGALRDVDDLADPADPDELAADDLVSVPKHYAEAERFPDTRERQVPGTSLLRSSAVALL